MAGSHSNRRRGRSRMENLSAADTGAGSEPRPAEPAGTHEPSSHPPVHYRPTPGFGDMTLRETRVVPVSWPGFLEGGADASPDEVRARRTLEQVGSILRRMQLDRLEIDGLRTETRSILQRIAA